MGAALTNMKTAALSYIATMLAVTAYADTVNFDNETPGTLPPQWVGTQTGVGKGKWSIEKGDDAPSKPNGLKQSGEASFPVCIKDDTKIKDGFVEVKFKPAAGKYVGKAGLEMERGQAGGIIWRCKDADNYYIAYANALEDRVTFYHTIGASSKSAKTKVAPGVWHTLRADFQGNHFTVTFDGRKVIEADDATFSDAGKVGVCTKAESVTFFDDFSFGGE
jgi:Domain of Unknown Function (DUF1080)